jgi:hypothetical protein
MCTCTKENKKVFPGKEKVRFKNGWRLHQLFRIEKLLKESGDISRGKRMGICGNTINVRVSSKNPENVLYEPELRCKDRLCPICNSYRSSILARKVEDLGKRMTNPHLLTVTAPNLLRDDLSKCFANYKTAMRAFKKNRSWFKKYIAGGVEHIEVTKSKERDWHIHSHMLVDLNVARKVENMKQVGHSKMLDPIKKELEIALEKCGLGTISDIRPVTSGYGKEISKYAMKFDKDITDDDIKEMAVSLRGKRMVSKFGSCYGIKDLEELEEEEQVKFVHIGSIKEVVLRCFTPEKADKRLFKIVLEMIKIGLIEFDFI